MPEQLKLEIDDYVEGREGFAIEEASIKPGVKYKVINRRPGRETEFLYELAGAGWWRCDSSNFQKVKCPVCGSDPCSCLDDEELDKAMNYEAVVGGGIIHSGKIQGRLVGNDATTYKHKPLPARALTSWFSIHDKMAAAKHLNELKDE